ncbi:MAG TPA: sigma-70 family RNA polymerase sigma factor [Vicinamibacterales bacterium]|nr:sigma-70 family RNA polymerase sigma factor [Vicinamibacterales bacterium]
MTDRRSAFEQVAMPVAPALLRTARRLVPGDDADDLVQETFLRAYRTFDSFRPGTNGKAWLFTILYSIVANRWRQESRRPVLQSLDAGDQRFADALSADLPGPDVLYGQAELRAVIDRALEGLPEEFRATLLLVDIEGLTYEEAAAVTASPVGTVRSRLSRARRQMFVTLQSNGAGARTQTDGGR